MVHGAPLSDRSCTENRAAAEVSVGADGLAEVGRSRPDLVDAMAGTVDGAALAGLVDGWCRDHLGSPVVAVPWAQASMGLAVAVDLADGRALVVKARPLDQAGRVAESRHLQAALADAGLPVPAPVGDLHPFGSGVAGAELRVDGATPIARPEVAASARLFHALVAAATRLCPPGLALHEPWGIALPPDQLWPDPPHDPRFDLTLPGADAIDAAARAARQRLAAAEGRPRVVGHVDWRAEHVLVDGNGAVVAVVDWDALARAPEPVLVGQAAAGCTIVWGRPGPHPTLAEARAFVAAYEDARGAPFSPDERDLLDAARGYVVAYGARCEHSDEATGRGDPGADGWRRLLAVLPNR